MKNMKTFENFITDHPYSLDDKEEITNQLLDQDGLESQIDTINYPGYFEKVLAEIENYDDINKDNYEEVINILLTAKAANPKLYQEIVKQNIPMTVWNNLGDLISKYKNPTTR